MKTLNQVRDELADAIRPYDGGNNEKVFKKGFDAAIDHLSKNAGERKWNIQIKHGKVMSGAGVFADCENVEVVEHSAYLSKCAQLAKAVETLNSARAAMKYAYEDHADKYYLNVEEQIAKTLSEIGAGK